jgi:serine/threonine protein kinase
VAVKVMTGRSFGDRDALRRFQREARASARLSHPNIVRTYDYGTLGESGAYLVLELLRGVTLRQMVQREERLSPRDAAEIFEQIFDGMRAAHAAGVVHRDLKPENILVVEEGEMGRRTVKILDFGLAKLHAPDVAETTSITTPGTIMGTFGYMAPEQLTGAESDERADVFALGVMLFEALTGRKPFSGRSWGDLLASIDGGRVDLPGDTPEIRRLEALLRRCLAFERGDRFASVTEARDALVPAVLDCAALEDAGPDEVDSAPTQVLDDR